MLGRPYGPAPGRVDLMGSHTDYNLGHVLTLPIGRDTWIAAMPRDDRRVRLYSLNLDDEATFGLDRIEPAPSRHWSDYPRGVAKVLGDERYALAGFDGVLHGTVPIGSGLSSSAALECVTATVFEALGGWRLDPVEKAKLCQRAENRFVGVNCGILDQFTSCLGREGCALLLDCRDLTSRPVQIAPGIRVVICDTREARAGRLRVRPAPGRLRTGGGAARRDGPAGRDSRGFRPVGKSLPRQVARRCRFIIEENERVLRMAEALPRATDRPSQPLCELVRRSESAVRDRCPGDGRDDGGHAGRPRRDRRPPGRGRLRRLHGRLRRGASGRQLRRVRAGRLLPGHRPRSRGRPRRGRRRGGTDVKNRVQRGRRVWPRRWLRVPCLRAVTRRVSMEVS